MTQSAESDVPEADLVHWSPRPYAGALHPFPKGSTVTRVASEITCPTCRSEMTRKDLR